MTMETRSHRSQLVPAAAAVVRAGSRPGAGPALPHVRGYLEGSPVASAVVAGPTHELVFMNAAFRQMSAGTDTSAALGEQIGQATPPEARAELHALLDGVRGGGGMVHDIRLGGPADQPATLLCDAWPVIEDGQQVDCLVVTLRTAYRGGRATRQRAITERLLLTALREQELAERADVARARAVWVADTSRRLGTSLELEMAYSAIATVALPEVGAWCIVDVGQPGGDWRRLAIVHPDPAKEALARALAGHWGPAAGDPIGAPLVAQSRVSMIVDEGTDSILSAAAHDTKTLDVLRSLDFGPLLVVPLIAHDRLRGAITFVGPRDGSPYTAADVLLAEDLAIRCADLIDGARLYDDGRLAQVDADTAHRAAESAHVETERTMRIKSSFLTSMSHELRTPLNAILGYNELLMMGIKGPVSADQQGALSGIRVAGMHLLGLINKVLNVAKHEEPVSRVPSEAVPVNDVLHKTALMIQPQASARGILFTCIPCAATLVMSVDSEKLLQILINLLSNAVKFTDAGGRVSVTAMSIDRRRPGTGSPAAGSPAPSNAPAPALQVTVTDTGRGIAAEHLATIFDPFVQVGPSRDGTNAGSGLGLAISQDLARQMHGEITVTSQLGVGSTFTLTVPCATCRDPGPAWPQRPHE
jgi:signal transduction histidine kinase